MINRMLRMTTGSRDDRQKFLDMMNKMFNILTHVEGTEYF